MINKMEEIVIGMADDLISKQDENTCKCDRCRMDIIALALNSLPPKYVVTTIGNAVTNVSLNSSQGKANITMAICKAIEVVKGKPRH
jgi:competence protein ComFB